jgi:aspartate/glutamate racemase
MVHPFHPLEIALRVKQEDVEIPIFDATTIHAKAALD